MCLQAFVEAFFYLAQRRFKSLPLHEQVTALADLCGAAKRRAALAACQPEGIHSVPTAPAPPHHFNCPAAASKSADYRFHRPVLPTIKGNCIENSAVNWSRFRPRRQQQLKQGLPLRLLLTLIGWVLQWIHTGISNGLRLGSAEADQGIGGFFFFFFFLLHTVIYLLNFHNPHKMRATAYIYYISHATCGYAILWSLIYIRFVFLNATVVWNIFNYEI